MSGWDGFTGRILTVSCYAALKIAYNLALYLQEGRRCTRPKGLEACGFLYKVGTSPLGFLHSFSIALVLRMLFWSIFRSKLFFSGESFALHECGSIQHGSMFRRLALFADSNSIPSQKISDENTLLLWIYCNNNYKHWIDSRKYRFGNVTSGLQPQIDLLVKP